MQNYVNYNIWYSSAFSLSYALSLLFFTYFLSSFDILIYAYGNYISTIYFCFDGLYSVFGFYLGPIAIFNQPFLYISGVQDYPKIVNCGYVLKLSAAGTMKLIIKGQDIFSTIKHSYVK